MPDDDDGVGGISSLSYICRVALYFLRKFCKDIHTITTYLNPINLSKYFGKKTTLRRIRKWWISSVNFVIGINLLRHRKWQNCDEKSERKFRTDGDSKCAGITRPLKTQTGINVSILYWRFEKSVFSIIVLLQSFSKTSSYIKSRDYLTFHDSRTK